MKFCPECGASDLTPIVPSTAHSVGWNCRACGQSHYHSPKLVAVCLAEWQGRVLLCRRATEPNIGQWTLPGGYVNASLSLCAADRRTHAAPIRLV
jgi:NADH pyrophosphatase NudC (nudix superfamily)